MLDVVRPEPLRRRTLLRIGLFTLMVACTVFSYMLLNQWEDKRVRQSLEAMRRVPGVGDKKLADYGDAFLDAIGRYERSAGNAGSSA